MSIDYLREAHSRGNLHPFVGAGFGMATSGLPSWSDLLQRGLDFVHEKATSPDERSVEGLAGQVKAALHPNAPPRLLLDAFQWFQSTLATDSERHYESLDYQAFLTSVFHEPPLNSRSLADALREFRPRLCFTTNYDSLLETHHVTSGGEWATWLEPSEIGSMLRVGAGVVHLHGRYDVPESVILSRRDYDRLNTPNDANALTQAIFHSGVLMFVATSLEAVSDPHLARILEGFRAIAGSRSVHRSPHVMLVRGRPSNHEIARLRGLGVAPLQYGDQFEDLPGFLRSVVERERIRIAADSVSGAIGTPTSARSRGELLRAVENFIREEIYGGRSVRVSFAELCDVGLPSARLEARHVLPPSATHNVFNYPLSIAAWALIEGRIIAWPDDRHRCCDLDLVDRLSRLDDVARLLAAPETADAPEIRRYVDVEVVRAKFETATLELGDFYQDWASNQPAPRYSSFVSLPVPVVTSFGNRQRIPQYGVFNIDSKEPGSLLDSRTAPLLRLASSLASLAYSMSTFTEAEL